MARTPRIYTCKPTPDGVNPYDFPGSGGVPEYIHRAMSTPAKLAKETKNVMSYRGISFEQAVQESGLPDFVIREIITQGTGQVDDVVAFCDYLRLVPVLLPSAQYLRIKR